MIVGFSSARLSSIANKFEDIHFTSPLTCQARGVVLSGLVTAVSFADSKKQLKKNHYAKTMRTLVCAENTVSLELDTAFKEDRKAALSALLQDIKETRSALFTAKEAKAVK